MEKSVVTATAGQAKDIMDAPASVSVVDKEDLQRRPYRSLGEALEFLPGVNVSYNSSASPSISMRGLSSAYTLVLIDGMRQTSMNAQLISVNVYNGFMPPTSAIERIEVIRGPMSTLYGSDALGGVVNVITKPVPKEWGGNVTLRSIITESSAQGSTLQPQIYLAGPLSDKVGLALRAQTIHHGAPGEVRDNLGQVITPSRGAYTPAFKYFLQNYGARLSYTPDSQNLIYADIDYAFLDYANPITSTGIRGVQAKDSIGIQNINANVVHSGDYSFGNWKNSLQYLRWANTGVLLENGANRTVEANDFIASSRLNLTMWDSNILNLGAEYRLEHYKDSILNKLNQYRNSLALYAEDEWQIFEPLIFTAGARYNFSDQFGSFLAPRAYLVYNITDSWNIKGGVATGYRAASISESSDAVRGVASWGAAIGNSKLKPESSISYELGTMFDNEYIDFSLTGFYTDFKNAVGSISGTGANISPVCPNPAGTCYMLSNIIDARSYGLESSFGIKPIFGVGFDMNYTLTRNTQIDGNDFYLMPIHKFSAKLSYTYEKFNVYLQGLYSSHYSLTSTYRNIPAIREFFGGQYYKPYTLLNLGASYVFDLGRKNKLRVDAGIYNLLNVDFYKTNNFQYINNNGVLTDRYVNLYGPSVQDGRRYYVNVSFDF
ncbi:MULTISPECIES: TonB-dependent receptor domain-containing protein [unclassified Helicobacter]|uniref:TonB-dependent receptor domain-containing protein n=1 Tax=unclassified Helicobacter TaxID=2593540 RepID=UPI0011C0289C|nr:MULTISPECIES: TonB-dependent receptor [unclassified Helicobacter]